MYSLEVWLSETGDADMYFLSRAVIFSVQQQHVGTYFYDGLVIQ